jgi:hypothetical protein
MNAKVRRRDVLAAGAASAVALALPAQASAEVPDVGVLAGTLDRVLSPHEAEVTVFRHGATRRVVLAPGADVLHGRAGVVSDLREFVAGETVAFRPEDRHPGGDHVLASEFKSLVECVAARVDRRDQQRVETSSGAFVVSPILRREAGGIQAGPARITYWTDPRTGTRHANTVTAS